MTSPTPSTATSFIKSPTGVEEGCRLPTSPVARLLLLAEHVHFPDALLPLVIGLVDHGSVVETTTTTSPEAVSEITYQDRIRTILGRYPVEPDTTLDEIEAILEAPDEKLRLQTARVLASGTPLDVQTSCEIVERSPCPMAFRRFVATLLDAEAFDYLRSEGRHGLLVADRALRILELVPRVFPGEDERQAFLSRCMASDRPASALVARCRQYDADDVARVLSVFPAEIRIRTAEEAYLLRARFQWQNLSPLREYLLGVSGWALAVIAMERLRTAVSNDAEDVEVDGIVSLIEDAKTAAVPCCRAMLAVLARYQIEGSELHEALSECLERIRSRYPTQAALWSRVADGPFNPDLLFRAADSLTDCDLTDADGGLAEVLEAANGLRVLTLVPPHHIVPLWTEHKMRHPLGFRERMLQALPLLHPVTSISLLGGVPIASHHPLHAEGGATALGDLRLLVSAFPIRSFSLQIFGWSQDFIAALALFLGSPVGRNIAHFTLIPSPQANAANNYSVIDEFTRRFCDAFRIIHQHTGRTISLERPGTDQAPAVANAADGVENIINGARSLNQLFIENSHFVKRTMAAHNLSSVRLLTASWHLQH